MSLSSSAQVQGSDLGPNSDGGPGDIERSDKFALEEVIRKLALLRTQRMQILRTFEQGMTYVPLQCGETMFPGRVDMIGRLPDETVEDVVVSHIVAYRQAAGSDRGSVHEPSAHNPNVEGQGTDPTTEVRGIILIGPPGSGKTTVLRHIELMLWERFDSNEFGIARQFLPLFWKARAANDGNVAMYPPELVLQDLGGQITLDDLAIARDLGIRPVWIIDSDEDEPEGKFHGTVDFFTFQRCIAAVRKLPLSALPRQNWSQSESVSRPAPFIIRYLYPLNRAQIEVYLGRLIAQDPDLATLGTPTSFAHVLQTVKGLISLASHPATLPLIVNALPQLLSVYPSLRDRIEKKAEERAYDSALDELTETWYLRFATHEHFARVLERWKHSSGWPRGLETSFVAECQRVCEELSVALLYRRDDKEAKKPYEASIQATLLPWPEQTRDFILQALPIRVTQDGAFEFICPSLWRYFLACMNTRLPQAFQGRSFATIEQSLLDRFPFLRSLGIGRFTTDWELLRVHAEMLAIRQEVIETYIDLVKATRSHVNDLTLDSLLVTAASNAISVLNYGAVKGLLQFRLANVRDWREIRVPFANLHSAVVSDCTFERADLSNCVIAGAIVRNSIFRGADLRDVAIGITPLFYGSTDPRRACFSPDSQFLAVGFGDNVIRVWNLLTGQQIATLEGHTDAPNDLCFSADSKLLASTSQDETVRIWDLETNTCLKVLTGHMKQVTCVSFHPNSTIVASAATDGIICLWNLATGQCIKHVPHSHGTARILAFTPDGNSMISLISGYARIWDLSSLPAFVEVETPVTTLIFNPTGNLVAFGGVDRCIHLWDLVASKPISKLKGHKRELSALSFSNTGNYLASGSEDRSVRVWHVPSGQCIAALEGHTETINALCFSPDGGMLVSAGCDGTLRLWNLSTNECIATRCIIQQDGAIDARILPNGRILAVGAVRKFLYTVNLTYEDCLAERLQGHSDVVTSVCFSPVSSTTLASSSQDKFIRIWDIRLGQCKRVLLGHTGDVKGVCYSPDGACLLSWSARDDTICVWDARTGRCKAKVFEQVTGAIGVCYSFDGRKFATVSNERSIRIWDANTTECVMTISDFDENVICAAFSPDGATIAMGGSQGNVYLRKVSTGECIHKKKAHLRLVTCMCFSPSGALLASCSEDRCIGLWNPLSMECLASLTGHESTITTICFSPDSSVLASGSSDRVIRLWDTRTWQELACLEEAHSHSITTMSFNLDGTYLASASRDHSIRIWRITYDTERVSGDGSHMLVSLHTVLRETNILQLQADFTDARLDPSLERLLQG